MLYAHDIFGVSWNVQEKKILLSLENVGFLSDYSESVFIGDLMNNNDMFFDLHEKLKTLQQQMLLRNGNKNVLWTLGTTCRLLFWASICFLSIFEFNSKKGLLPGTIFSYVAQYLENLKLFYLGTYL